MFQRIAIVNRGEAAMRLIHAVRDLNAQAGPGATDRDRGAAHRGRADRDVRPRGGCGLRPRPASRAPYLDHAVLERALRETGADAAWVGWGFVAEDPAFAELCERIGVTFIGPSAEAMRRLGDKIGSKLIAEEVGVPVAPWSRGGGRHPRGRHGGGRRDRLPADAQGDGGRRWSRHPQGHLRRRAGRRVRADPGRGGAGLRLAASSSSRSSSPVPGTSRSRSSPTARAPRGPSACATARCSAATRRSSRSPPRRCSTPSRPPSSRRPPNGWPSRSATAGAGTVEFLYHPGERLFAFLEVNTRLQVEHPITEVTTGTDLVKAAAPRRRRRPARGASRPSRSGTPSRPGSTPRTPTATSPPSPGPIAHLELPAGPGIRVDTGVAEGDSIPADFDSMIAKIIASGRDRDEALARLRRAMRETTVVIEGGATNKSLHPRPARPARGRRRLARTPGGSTGSAPRVGSSRPSTRGSRSSSPASRPTRRRRRSSARGSSRRRGAGVRRCSTTWGRAVDLKLRGTAYKVTVFRTGAGTASGSASPSRRARSRRSTPTSSGSAVREPGDRRRAHPPPRHGGPRPVQLVEVDGVTHRVSRDEGGVLRSPAPALVVATPAGGRRRGRGGRTGARARVHEDGDGAARTVRRPGQGAARRPPAARSRPVRRWCGSSPPATAARPVRPPPTRPTSTCPRTATATPAAGGARARRPRRDAARLRPRPRATRAACSPATSRPATSSRLGRRIAGRRGDRPPGRLRRLRRAEPQPAGGRGGPHREPGAQPARALPHLPADPRPRARRAARRLRRPARAGAPPLRRHRPRPHAGARGGRLPGLPRPAALGAGGRDGHLDPPAVARRAGARAAAADAPPASCSTASSRPPSCASRSSATSPAACASAGSTSRCRRRPGVACSRRGRELDEIDAMPDGDGSHRADRRAGGDPRADRAVPRRAARRGCPPRSRCSPC